MKKTVILLLILTMVLTGCGTKEEPSADPAVNETTEQTAGSETETDAPDVSTETTEPAADPATDPGVEGEAGTVAEEDMDAYARFLANEEACVLAKDLLGTGSRGSSYNLSELVEATRAYFAGEELSSVLDSVQSAFIDCGDDGIKELALQINLKPTEDSEYYDLTQLFTLKFMDGGVQLVGGDWGYYRSWVSMNPYGIINLVGSTRASSYFVSTSFADADGTEHFIYSASVEMGLAEAGVDYYDIPESLRPADYPYIEMSDSDTSYYCTEAYSFTESSDYDDYDTYLMNRLYRFSDADDNDAEPSDELKAVYEEIGLKWFDTDTLSQIMDERLAELGLTEEMMIDSTEPEWEAVIL